MGQQRLFGREREVAQWRLLADSVAAGRNAGLTISGPSGIGKSALLEAICQDAQARGWKLLRAVGDENRQLPGAMLWQWFAPLAQQHPAGLPPFDGQGALLHRFLTDTELDVSQDALSYSASWVLRSLGQQQPVAAVVDDAQWLDELSLAVLLDVGSLLLDVPVLLLRGLRTGTPRPAGGTADGRREDLHALVSRGQSSGAELHWNLKPLSHEAIENWLTARRQDTLAVSAARLQAASGGVPFFIRELLEREQDYSLDPGSREDAILRERLDRLPEAGRQVLAAAAVLGEDASAARIAAVLGTEPAQVAAGLRSLQEGRFLSTVRPRPRIQHALIAETLLAGLDPAALARLQRRAAEALLADGAGTAAVAGHLLAAPAGADQRTARVLLDAAADARRRGAHGMAVQLGERGLEEGGLPADLRRQLLVETAQAREMAGESRRAEELARQALALTEGTAARGTLLLEFAETLYNNGRVEAAAECYAQALKELDNEPGAHAGLRRKAVAMAAGAGFQQMQFTRDYAALVGEVLAQDPAADGPCDRLLLVQEALRLTLAGEDARRTAELAVRAVAGGKLLAENGAASNIINYATGALTGTEQDAVALVLLDAAIAEARAGSAVMAHATLAYCRGALQLRRGRLRLAQVDLEACLRAADQGWRTYLEAACVIMAGIRIARDDLEPLDGLLARVPLAARRPPLVQAMALQLHGMAAAARGRHHAALEHFTAAMDLAEGLGPALDLWTGAAIESAVRSGSRDNLEYARVVAEEAVARARAFGAPRCLGTVLRPAALAQPPQAAVAMLREAAALLEAGSGRYDLALALADLAELCLLPGSDPALAGHRAEALAAARKGLLLANRIGAAGVARRMAALLAAQHAPTPAVAEQRADRLTPAEFRVCSLAARGLTNRQIAAELFITIKAVEWHLSRSFAKLEISSRRELAGALEPRE
ncbi:helix-turn-helix transcriptional regulator [Arthrobacter mobilis]|uniref:AAA family ATPase n=1 Tax=Arthrobacter mobilis TaxID=2724944 RepID=A0A7X6HFU2_9MICC|nr:LuxR family transcriptional regulator [Arthrobacter mobilis]NKX55605.1 AAA family ATPase [Arthrobacter mobilis]